MPYDTYLDVFDLSKLMCACIRAHVIVWAHVSCLLNIKIHLVKEKTKKEVKGRNKGERNWKNFAQPIMPKTLLLTCEWDPFSGIG